MYSSRGFFPPELLPNCERQPRFGILPEDLLRKSEQQTRYFMRLVEYRKMLQWHFTIVPLGFAYARRDSGNDGRQPILGSFARKLNEGMSYSSRRRIIDSQGLLGGLQ